MGSPVRRPPYMTQSGLIKATGMPTPMRWGALTDAQKAPFVKLAIEDERREKDEKKLLDASMVLARLSTWHISALLPPY